MNLNLPRSAYGVVQMMELAAELGLSAERSLEGSGLNVATLDNLEAEIATHQELTVIANIVRHLGEVPALGLQMGRRFHMSAYGVLAFALCSCPTVGDALGLALRHGTLSFPLIERTLEIHGNRVVLIGDDRHIPPPLRRFVVERDLGGMFNVAREMLAFPLPQRRITLAYPAPDYAERYAEFFEELPEFGAAQNTVSYDISAMALPMPQANAPVLRYCEAQLQTILERRKARSGTAGRVRDILLRRPGETPDMEAIAAELRTTSRNLRRLLDAEGTSFRGLVDEVRQALAEELLAAQLNVEEVADRLGYNEVSSFTNAFKRWTGMPPSEWRNARRRGAETARP